MLNVSAAVKAKLKSDICLKELRIVIGNTTITNQHIYKDSFKLTESVMDDTVEFVGCIASALEMKVSTKALAKGDHTGKAVSASVAIHLDDNGTLSDYIPLFHGFVDSCEKSADGHYQSFVCYDILAYLTDTPAYNQYKAAFNGGTVTLAAFRSSVLGAFDIDEELATLPNDAVKFKKRYRNKDITALALIRHITQINGAFGIINRSNKFEYKYINDAATPESIPYYRSMEYAQNIINPINAGLNIRTNSNDAGVTVTWNNYQQYAGTDPGWSDESQDTYLVDDDDEDITEGNYIIESNLIAYKLKKSKKQVMAANIMANLGNDTVFRDYKVVCNGLPYIECCDKVLFTKRDNSQIEFVVVKRTLQGVQNMTDTYECHPRQEYSTDTGAASTAKASYVSNINKSTMSLSGTPDEALGLTEKSITQNGTYAANDDGAEGYSSVTVNVSGGGSGVQVINVPQGVPTGYSVNAQALTNLNAGDPVCVQETSAQSTLAIAVEHHIPDGWGVAYDCHGTVYMSAGGGSYLPKSVALQDLMDPSATYSDVTTIAGQGVSAGTKAFRNMVCFYSTARQRRWANVETDTSLIPSSYSGNDYFHCHSQKYFFEDSTYYSRISNMIRVGNAGSGGYRRRFFTDSAFAQIGTISSSTANNIAIATLQGNIKNIPLSYNVFSWFFQVCGDSVDDLKIIVVKSTANANGYYDVGYVEASDNNGIFHFLCETQTVYTNGIQYDAEAQRIWICLGTLGLAVIKTDMTVKIYSNIVFTMDSSSYLFATLFDKFFYHVTGTAIPGNLYYLPDSGNVMSSTRNINGYTKLGYAAQDVTAGQTGTAIVLFS